MTTKRLTRDDNLAMNVEEVLTTLLLDVNLPGIMDDEDDLPIEVNIIETYAEAGLLTSDKGLVVQLSDGRELHLTISAYKPT
jgi:predicted methyltransferase